MSWEEDFLKNNKRGKSIRNLRSILDRQRGVHMRSHASFDEASINYTISLFSICASHACAVFAALGSSLTRS